MPSGVFSLKQVSQALTVGAWSNQKPVNVDYLVVAGGGGGGRNWGGGGGAGGLLQGNIPVANGSAITVTVGAGGTGDTADINPKGGTSGNNSVFGSITAIGGGLGGSYNGINGASGGSGGGQGSGASPGTNGQGTSGQGNAGGLSDNNGTNSCAGGGGGAGTVGLSFTATRGGNGGAGIASDISGTRTTYAGGGGGTSNSGSSSVAGSGGAGGGGAGGTYPSAGTAGTANTGGGGGGGPYQANGGNGGSGIVIISYPDIYQAAASTTGSPTVTTSGAGSLYFDGSGDYITYADNALFKPGTGDFTIEGWVYHDSAIGSVNAYFTSATGGISFYRNGSGKLELGLAGTGALATSTNNVTSNQWVHVAAARSGTSLKVFINGVQEASVTNSTNFTFTGGCDIGGSGASFSMSGYISNFRFIKGSALYTGAFTVPSAPLRSVSGTSLLLNTVSGSPFADSSGNGLTCTVTGSTAWNALSPISTGLGFKNRVYRWTSSGSITF